MIKKSIKNFFQAWLKIGKYIAYLNTKLILGIMFHTIFTPYGLFAKLITKNLLDLKINADTSTYWKEKEYKTVEYYKQY